ncbi:MAG: enoyl-CoA hydratase-related protein [Myxococcota bacterium]|jgi:methylglutaconyl-CoA hydratase|nr:enoyl-CoA hydratase-related protein [Myxococcota bacterium]
MAPANESSFQHLELIRRGPVVRVVMNRPDVHNAFNERLIDELALAFGHLETDASCRVIVLEGRGRSFCAGADLGWMRSMATHTDAENVRDARELARLFSRIDGCSVPVIGRIQGAAIGGGAGLVACCDIPIAASRAKFGFSEVRLGMAPAVISPFVVAKIGLGAARELFVTGSRFDAARALEIGLVNRVVDDEAALDAAVDDAVHAILQGAPGAVTACKDLARSVGQMQPKESFESTARLIARLRAAPEGQEGMSAFLERRRPSWAVTTDEGS